MFVTTLQIHVLSYCIDSIFNTHIQKLTKQIIRRKVQALKNKCSFRRRVMMQLRNVKCTLNVNVRS